jgi:hypothetical protein
MKLRSFVITLALGAIILSPSAAMGQRVSAQGLVVSVGWQDGTLLLETPEGFPLLVLDVAVNIRDPLGIIGVLGDFQAGDVVEYWAESFKGMLIAQELRVISVSFCGKELRDPAPRQWLADEAETAASCVSKELRTRQ